MIMSFFKVKNKLNRDESGKDEERESKLPRLVASPSRVLFGSAAVEVVDEELEEVDNKTAADNAFNVKLGWLEDECMFDGDKASIALVSYLYESYCPNCLCEDQDQNHFFGLLASSK